MSEPASGSTPSMSGTQDDKIAKRKEYKAMRDSSRVALLGSFARWRAFKAKHGLNSDADVAEMLLDHFETISPVVW